jgi:soluble lytic murein transglycosylase
MHNFPQKILLAIITLAAACSLIHASANADGLSMESAFWIRNWDAMDSIYSASIPAGPPEKSSSLLSPRELSIYVNALWLQGRYDEGVLILERIHQDFPEHLRAYADILFVLGAERSGRTEEAFEKGNTLWNSDPPPQVRYYLAYAMARISRDLAFNDESIVWLRRMYELAPDKRRATLALDQIIELGGANADEIAAWLINSPANVQSASVLSGDVINMSGLVEYALGYKAYSGKLYTEAMAHFELASRDVEYGEAARYYGAYSAYREKKNDLAYSLWSDIALTGFDYPQRSVQRLENLAEHGKKSDVLKLLKKVAAAREKDYPEVAADALSVIIRLGDPDSAREAEKTLFSVHASTAQAATIRWERGWKAWKAKNFKSAYDQWSSGYSPLLKNHELASRFLYWQVRALEKLKSPAAAERVKNQLVENYPGEYHTFLVNPEGGLKIAPTPEKYVTSSDLTDWGFVTYARLEGANITPDKATSEDIPILCRSVRIALWEEDFPSAVRMFSVLQKIIPPSELSSSGLLQMAYPRAFERDVLAASVKTGIAPEIIWGVMRQESLYEPGVTSSAGAYGLMQLMPATARGEAKKMNISADAYLNPPDNIMLGANHLVGLFARFKKAPLSLAAYNAGGSPVSRWSKMPITDMAEWVEDIAYRETRGYVKAVLRNIQAYKLLYPAQARK